MIDLISVVFRDELPLLKIQGQSINQYVGPNIINSITVVVNEDEPLNIDPAWWGQHHSKVNVKIRNFRSRVSGWESQQICKLLEAGCSSVNWSMILDAKTWFIQPLDLAKVFDGNRAYATQVPISEHFNSSREFVENYFNITMPKIIGPGGVPFMIHTATAAGLINDVDNFVEFFQSNVTYPNLLTEFHLYSGYVLSKYGSYDALYKEQQSYTFFNIAPEDEVKFVELRDDCLTASIHRKVYSRLSNEQRDYWNNFLINRKLIDKYIE